MAITFEELDAIDGERRRVLIAFSKELRERNGDGGSGASDLANAASQLKDADLMYLERKQNQPIPRFPNQTPLDVINYIKSPNYNSTSTSYDTDWTWKNFKDPQRSFNHLVAAAPPLSAAGGPSAAGGGDGAGGGGGGPGGGGPRATATLGFAAAPPAPFEPADAEPPLAFAGGRGRHADESWLNKGAEELGRGAGRALGAAGGTGSAVYKAVGEIFKGHPEEALQVLGDNLVRAAEAGAEQGPGLGALGAGWVAAADAQAAEVGDGGGGPGDGGAAAAGGGVIQKVSGAMIAVAAATIPVGSELAGSLLGGSDLKEATGKAERDLREAANRGARLGPGLPALATGLLAGSKSAEGADPRLDAAEEAAAAAAAADADAEKRRKEQEEEKKLNALKNPNLLYVRCSDGENMTGQEATKKTSIFVSFSSYDKLFPETSQEGTIYKSYVTKEDFLKKLQENISDPSNTSFGGKNVRICMMEMNKGESLKIGDADISDQTYIDVNDKKNHTRIFLSKPEYNKLDNYRKLLVTKFKEFLNGDCSSQSVNDIKERIKNFDNIVDINITSTPPNQKIAQILNLVNDDQINEKAQRLADDFLQKRIINGNLNCETQDAGSSTFQDEPIGYIKVVRSKEDQKKIEIYKSKNDSGLDQVNIALSNNEMMVIKTEGITENGIKDFDCFESNAQGNFIKKKEKDSLSKDAKKKKIDVYVEVDNSWKCYEIRNGEIKLKPPLTLDVGPTNFASPSSAPASASIGDPPRTR